MTLAVIYLHEFIKKTTQGKDLSINLDTLPKNNLIQFPIHDDIPSNEEVGVWLTNFFKKNIRLLKTADHRSIISEKRPSLSISGNYWKTELFDLVRMIVNFCRSLLLSSCETSENLIEQESDLRYRVKLCQWHKSAGNITTTNKILLEELLKNFDKLLRFYPLIDAEMIRYSKSGLVYRVGMNDPFTGRVQKEGDGGVIQFQASFLKGVPHGLHLRRFDNGKPSMESIFDRVY